MIATALNYAQARMEALGYEEWEDDFNHENIPQNKLEDVYQIEVGSISGGQQNQYDLEILVPLKVYFFVAPKRDVLANRDSALSALDTLVAAFVLGSNRLAYGSGLKDVRFKNAALEKLADSNDNGMKVTAEFDALVIITAG